MSFIKIKNIWKEDRNIKKGDIINEKFNCDIFINDIKFSENMEIKEENDICIKFHENYDNISNMFLDCESLTMEYMFVKCGKLASLDLSSFDTSNVTNMSHMFKFCTTLTELDLSNFKTDKVTNMEYMFVDCEKITSLDLSYLLLAIKICQFI